MIAERQGVHLQQSSPLYRQKFGTYKLTRGSHLVQQQGGGVYSLVARSYMEGRIGSGHRRLELVTRENCL